MSTYRALAEETAAYAIPIRHDLHAHPELGYEEVRTAGVVARELAALGIEHRVGLAGGTGVLGWLPATVANAPTVALRADMDALPITERTGVAYSSTVPGKMHACGHDGHTSILLGTARALTKLSDRPNNVLFVFQPAEEGGAGGKRMCDDGVLDGSVLGRPANAIYGLHGWVSCEVGQVLTRPGPLMAATDSIQIDVRGKGCHAAYPHLGVDPILVAAQIISALQTVASRTVAPVDSVVVTIASIHGGNAWNVIPETVTLGGTLRTLRPETRELAKRRIREIAAGVADANGANVVVQFGDGYPTTVNDEAMTQRFFDIAERTFGAERVFLAEHPTMGGEDFSFYGHHVPACFFFLGLREGATPYPNLHSPEFDFNDRAVAVGIEAMTALVQEPL